MWAHMGSKAKTKSTQSLEFFFGDEKLNEYDEKADIFLKKHGIKLSIRRGDYKEPLWGRESDGHFGDHYRIVVTRKDGKRISFSFWGSIADMQEGKDPRPYDILACMSSDSSMPTDPDEVQQEFGGNIKQALATVKFAERLQGFFTEEELTDLREIQ